jgi:3-oxoadipate enol-lactonase
MDEPPPRAPSRTKPADAAASGRPPGDYDRRAEATDGTVGLHHVRLGDGPALLLLPGMASTQLHWGNALLERLSASFMVVAVEHRGTGRSPDAPGGFDLQDLADDAAALLARLGLDTAHVFGVSMGGAVAQELALRHPARVDRLVLGCTRAPKLPRRPGGASPLALLSGVAVPGDRVATLRNFFRLGVAPGFAERPGAWEAYRDASEALPVSPAVTVRQLDAMARHDLSDRLRALAAHTLVLHGEADRMVSRADGRQLADALPRASFCEVPGGHLFWWEQPELVAGLVTDFLLSRP